MIVTLLIFTLGGLACAFASTYDQMWWLRFVQGIGLGGEVPLMAAYVNEFAKAEGRGRFSLSAPVLFSIGLPSARSSASMSCRILAGSGCSSSARCRR